MSDQKQPLPPVPPRAELPKRRIAHTLPLSFGDGRFTVSIGYRSVREAQAVEVFADGGRSGSDMEALLDDACILVSLMLQHGLTASYLLDRVSRHSNGGAASVIGAILGAAVADEQRRATELGEAL